MKVYDISYLDKRRMDEIAEICGKNLNLIDNFKLGGAGSPRIYYKSGNSEIDSFFGMNSNIKVCNLQIRKQGFMFRFNDNTVVKGLPFSNEMLRLIKVYTIPQKKYKMGIDFYLLFEKDMVLEFEFDVQQAQKMQKFLLKPPFENKVEWKGVVFSV